MVSLKIYRVSCFRIKVPMIAWKLTSLEGSLARKLQFWNWRPSLYETFDTVLVTQHTICWQCFIHTYDGFVGCGAHLEKEIEIACYWSGFTVWLVCRSCLVESRKPNCLSQTQIIGPISVHCLMTTLILLNNYLLS